MIPQRLHAWRFRNGLLAASAAAALACTAGCSGKRITADTVYFPAPPATPHVVHLKSFNALSDLVDRPQHWLDVLRGRVVSPFAAKPAGIACANGHLYLCDLEINAVHDWDLSTGRTRRWGETGDIVLRKPVDVAVGDDGALYVADTGRSCVVVLSAEGGARELRPDRAEYRPVALAVHGDELYVADVAGHRIDVYSIPGGPPTRSFGEIGDAPGKMYFPSGVAIDSAGRVYLSDLMNARVQVLAADGSPQLTMGQPGDRYGDMGKPRHLDVGPDGVIFVADGEFQHVHLFDDQGRLLMLLGGDAPLGGTPMPVGVAVAQTLPAPIAALVPAGFHAHYYLFVTNSIGEKRISLYAVGLPRNE